MNTTVGQMLQVIMDGHGRASLHFTSKRVTEIYLLPILLLTHPSEFENRAFSRWA